MYPAVKAAAIFLVIDGPLLGIGVPGLQCLSLTSSQVTFRLLVGFVNPRVQFLTGHSMLDIPKNEIMYSAITLNVLLSRHLTNAHSVHGICWLYVTSMYY